MKGATSAHTISTRFALIFWGLLLAIVDINIFGIDIVPDFIGYILVALGCAGLASVSPRFSTASILGWILTGLSLVALIDNMLRDSFMTSLEYVTLAVDCAMIWFLLGGVMELARARERMDLSRRASQCRIVYIALVSLATLAGALGGPAVLMGIAAIVCVLVVLVLILHLLYRAKNELAADPTT